MEQRLYDGDRVRVSSTSFRRPPVGLEGRIAGASIGADLYPVVFGDGTAAFMSAKELQRIDPPEQETPVPKKKATDRGNLPLYQTPEELFLAAANKTLPEDFALTIDNDSIHAYCCPDPEKKAAYDAILDAHIGIGGMEDYPEDVNVLAFEYGPEDLLQAALDWIGVPHEPA